MKTHRRVVGSLDTNCYIVEDEGTKEAIIIDPGGDGQSILDFAKTLELAPRYVVLTHGHLDHIFDAGLIQSALGLPVLVSEADSVFLDDPGWMRSLFDFDSMIPVEERVFIKEGDLITFGNSNLRVIETPGHSRGSVSLYSTGVLFSGDVIFHGSVGRTDFPEGDGDLLLSSIRKVIMVLPDDTVIYPGHGFRTTVGKERAHNPFLL